MERSSELSLLSLKPFSVMSAYCAHLADSVLLACLLAIFLILHDTYLIWLLFIFGNSHLGNLALHNEITVTSEYLWKKLCVPLGRGKLYYVARDEIRRIPQHDNDCQSLSRYAIYD